jgi:hypothetical protein
VVTFLVGNVDIGVFLLNLDETEGELCLPRVGRALMVLCVRFLKWKLNKLKLKIEEKNAIIRYDGWWIPRVESNLRHARRSLQNKKQSNEEKDGHIQLVTLQKKQHIQITKRLKKSQGRPT